MLKDVIAEIMGGEDVPESDRDPTTVSLMRRAFEVCATSYYANYGWAVDMSPPHPFDVDDVPVSFRIPVHDGFFVTLPTAKNLQNRTNCPWSCIDRKHVYLADRGRFVEIPGAA